jgi:hypothetical protein
VSPGGFIEGDVWVVFKEHSYFSRLHAYAPYAQYKTWFYEDTKREKHLDCSPDYLHTPGTARRLRAVSPLARIVILLRNPVARAWSHYWHEVNVNNCEPQPWHEAVLRPVTCPEDYWYHFCYLEAGHYAEHLTQWYRHFPEEQILLLRSEDVFADFARYSGEVFLHLNLTGTPTGAIHVNIGSAPQMPDEVREQLETYYESHNRRLHDEYGINWKEKEDGRNGQIASCA